MPNSRRLIRRAARSTEGGCAVWGLLAAAWRADPRKGHPPETPTDRPIGRPRRTAYKPTEGAGCTRGIGIHPSRGIEAGLNGLGGMPAGCRRRRGRMGSIPGRQAMGRHARRAWRLTEARTSATVHLLPPVRQPGLRARVIEAHTRPSADAGAFFMPASCGLHVHRTMVDGAREPQGSPGPRAGLSTAYRPPPRLRAGRRSLTHARIAA
jgi:hypothetical protein